MSESKSMATKAGIGGTIVVLIVGAALGVLHYETKKKPEQPPPGRETDDYLKRTEFPRKSAEEYAKEKPAIRRPSGREPLHEGPERVAIRRPSGREPLHEGPDWPLFRGNRLQTGVAESSLPDDLEVRWKFRTKGAIEGGAAIVKGIVYIGSQDENLYAIDLATGNQKWKYHAAPFRAAPSVRDGFVYVGDLDGMFHCVDAEKGTKRWTFETGAEINSGANFAKGAVLFGSGDETLYCLNADDGKKIWSFKVAGGPVLGSPAVIGDRTFVAGCDSALHVIDTAKGTELAAVDIGGQVGATAAVRGDQLYLGTIATNQVLAIDWNKAQVLWKFEAARKQQPYYASVAVTDKLVIAASRDKLVHALDRENGKEVWNFATEDRIDSSPVVVGKRVFVGSLDGKLYVLDLEKGTKLNSFDLGSPIAGSPAVAGDCLVIGTTDGTVYCFGAKK
jgi:outer membrane protein assembly factor BamB